jgi:hypothetical protein
MQSQLLFPAFSAADLGNTQSFPAGELHPDPELDRIVFGIPPVKSDDYVSQRNIA